MSMLETTDADIFNRVLIDALSHYGVLCNLINEFTALTKKNDIDKDSIVVIYNEHKNEENLQNVVQKFLEKALECINRQYFPECNLELRICKVQMVDRLGDKDIL